MFCLFPFQKREERQLELEKNHAFIDDERRKTMERLRQYKMVRSISLLLAKCCIFWAGGEKGGRDRWRTSFYVMAIMELVHVAWNGCIIGNPSEAG